MSAPNKSTFTHPFFPLVEPDPRFNLTSVLRSIFFQRFLEIICSKKIYVDLEKLNKKGIKNWMKTKSQIAIEFEENPEEIIKNILFEHVFKKQLKTNSVYASLISD